MEAGLSKHPGLDLTCKLTSFSHLTPNSETILDALLHVAGFRQQLEAN